MRARLIAAAIVAVATAGVLVHPPDALALELPNGSAEQPDEADPDKPAAWSIDAWGDYVSSATFTWLNEGFEGKRALRVELSAPGAGASCGCGDAKWQAAPIDVAGLDLLRISDRYRCDRPSRLMLKFARPASPGTEARSAWVELAKAASASTWTEAAGTVQVPSWARTMRVVHLIDGPGRLDTDAYAVRVAEPPPVPLPPPGRIPLVSITFDDGWISAYHLLVPKMDERGLKGSFFIISDFLDRPGYGADYIGSEQMIDLANRGHEIGSHSREHKDQAKLGLSELRADLEGSKARLESFGATVVGFVPPYGSYNDTVLAEVHERYKYLRTVDEGLNAKPYDARKLKAVVVHSGMTLADFADWVIRAAVQDKWLVLIYHRASKDPPAPSFVRPADFRRQMDYLVQAKADCKPVGEVLGVWSWKPIVVEEPDVVTGDQLPVAPAPGRERGYHDPLDGNSGCTASAPTAGQGRAAKVAWQVPMLVIGAFFALRMRRKYRRFRYDDDDDDRDDGRDDDRDDDRDDGGEARHEAPNHRDESTPRSARRPQREADDEGNDDR